MMPTGSAQSCYDETRFSQICTDEAEAVRTLAAGPASVDKPEQRHWSHALRIGLQTAPDFHGMSPIAADTGIRLAYGVAAAVVSGKWIGRVQL